MFGFLFSGFIDQLRPKISCTKTQTFTNLRLPISYVAVPNPCGRWGSLNCWGALDPLPPARGTALRRGTPSSRTRPPCQSGSRTMGRRSWKDNSWDVIAFVHVRHWSSRSTVTNDRRPFGMRTNDLMVAGDRQPTTDVFLCYNISVTVMVKKEGPRLHDSACWLPHPLVTWLI